MHQMSCLHGTPLGGPLRYSPRVACVTSLSLTKVLPVSLWVETSMVPSYRKIDFVSLRGRQAVGRALGDVRDDVRGAKPARLRCASGA